MSNLNNVLLIGAVSQDPKSNQVGDKHSVVFTIAGQSEVIGQDGVTRHPVFYQRVNFLVSEKQRDALLVLTRGTVVVVAGKLEYREWGDEPKKSITEVRGLSIEKMENGSHELIPDSIGGIRLRNGLCRIELIGNLTRDADLRYTSNGHAVTTLRLAYNEKFKGSTGWTSKPHYFSATCWEDKAISDLNKGQPVFLSGRISNDSFTDNDGKPRYDTTIEVERWEVLNKPARVSDLTEDLPF